MDVADCLQLGREGGKRPLVHQQFCLLASRLSSLVPPDYEETPGQPFVRRSVATLNPRLFCRFSLVSPS